jgi:hypothetical protein
VVPEGLRSAAHDGQWVAGVEEGGGGGVRGSGCARQGKRGGNGLSVVCWCCWVEEGGKKSRHECGTWRRRGGGRQQLGWPWRSRKRTTGEGSKAGEGEGRRVESAQAVGGAGEELEWRWAVLAVGSRGEQRSRAGRQRKKKTGGPGDLFAKIEKSRDPTVN